MMRFDRLSCVYSYKGNQSETTARGPPAHKVLASHLLSTNPEIGLSVGVGVWMADFHEMIEQYNERSASRLRQYSLSAPGSGWLEL